MTAAERDAMIERAMERLNRLREREESEPKPALTEERQSIVKVGGR